jgi:hypothetical protein
LSLGICTHFFSVWMLGRAVVTQTAARLPPGSSAGPVMWDVLWKGRHWGRFPPSTSVFPATHSFHQSLHNHHHLLFRVVI